MARLPRVAIGTIQPQADVEPILWALVEALRRQGVHAQSFLSQACFPRHQGAAAVTGLAPRHLDSWLMSPEMCRDTFMRGVHAADLALVEGEFRTTPTSSAVGGSLDTLCDWLALPRLVVLDGAQLGGGPLPDRPADAEGILLDHVTSERQIAQVTADLEILWGIPVLGALERGERLFGQRESLPPGGRPSEELCRELGDRFVQHWSPERIWNVAASREWPDVALHQVCPEPMRSKLTLAVAYDEAFNCYFPDTLDWLELRGATVVDFSPLREECLPPDTDIVYLGCGHPERFTSALAENHCMKAALRNHLRGGRRIYGEGGGLAYLCEYMEAPDASLHRMVGLIPATARLRRPVSLPKPMEFVLSDPCWLGDPGERLRGYRNVQWDLEPVGADDSFTAQSHSEAELVGGFHVVGSLLHLDFATQPEFLRRFFYPNHPCSPAGGVE
jgi:cobyrinic acid a,c-diamide synthase